MTETAKKFLSLKDVSLPWQWIAGILVSVGVLLATVSGMGVKVDATAEKAHSNELAIAAMAPQVETIHKIMINRYGRPKK